MKEMTNDPIQESTLAGSLTVGQLLALIRQEIEASMGQSDHRRGDAIGRPPEAGRGYLTVKEAANMARLGTSTIRLYIRKGKLKAGKVGRRRIIKQEDLEALINGSP